jgi:protein-tyrosine phosphatase
MNVLFLCTGNYYRSRFAEEWFNHLAIRQGIAWRADSRGLAASFPRPRNPGTISVHVLAELERRGATARNPHRDPARVAEADLARASRVIALSEAEHRPLVAAAFPGWLERVEWWEVGDIPLETVEAALAKIGDGVLRLVAELAGPEAGEGTPDTKERSGSCQMDAMH